MFEGAAGGETFQGIGKVDVHLRITQGEVFIAELKFWDGPNSLRETVGQLRSRLTWRDSFGVALVLSKNEGFSDVLKSVDQTIPAIDGFVPGTLRRQSENRFVGRVQIPSDDARQVTIHVLVYNLYLPRQESRTARTARRR